MLCIECCIPYKGLARGLGGGESVGSLLHAKQFIPGSIKHLKWERTSEVTVALNPSLKGEKEINVHILLSS